jgi:hypothetical protein
MLQDIMMKFGKENGRNHLLNDYEFRQSRRDRTYTLLTS